MDSVIPPRQSERLGLALFFGSTLILAETACWFLWIFSRLIESEAGMVIHHPYAPLTQFFFDYRLGILLFPVPWLGVSIAACIRGHMRTLHQVMFSSTLILSLGTLSIVLALAFSLPWLPAKFVTMGARQSSAASIPK